MKNENTPEVVDELGKRLEEERSRLRSELKELGVDLEEGAVDLAMDDGFADSAAATAEKSETLALIDQLRETLSEVEAALARIDAGTYGKCEMCGNEIPLARLQARPHASLCLSCQEKSLA